MTQLSQLADSARTLSFTLEWNEGMEAGRALLFCKPEDKRLIFGAPRPGGVPESLLTLQRGRQSPELLASRFLVMC